MMWQRIGPAVGAVAFLAAPLSAQSDFSYSKNLAAKAELAVRNIIGDIRIERASGRTLEVTARKTEGRHGDPDDVEIEARELDGGGVAICVYYPSNGRWNDRDRDEDDRDQGDRVREGRHRRDVCRRDGGWNNNIRNDTRVDLTLRIPADLVVDIKTVSGDVRGGGLSGELDLASVSGDVVLDGLEASKLRAHTVSGDVELSGVRAADVEAETVSGDVTYAGTIESRGDYFFKTLSGDVELSLPKEPDARLDGSTFSGRLISDLPTERNGRRRFRNNRFSATWGEGSANIEVESFSGTVRIRSAK